MFRTLLPCRRRLGNEFFMLDLPSIKGCVGKCRRVENLARPSPVFALEFVQFAKFVSDIYLWNLRAIFP
jgi:hypothetical protein